MPGQRNSTDSLRDIHLADVCLLFRSCACLCAKCSTDAARKLLPAIANLLASPNAAVVAARTCINCLRHWYQQNISEVRLKTTRKVILAYSRMVLRDTVPALAALWYLLLLYHCNTHPVHFESLKRRNILVSDTQQPYLCRTKLDSVPATLPKGFLAAWSESTRFSRLPGIQTCVKHPRRDDIPTMQDLPSPSLSGTL